MIDHKRLTIKGKQHVFVPREVRISVDHTVMTGRTLCGVYQQIRNDKRQYILFSNITNEYAHKPTECSLCLSHLIRK